MARPVKKGLEYFSLDTHWDNSMELVQAKFGPEGIGIIIAIWQKIYAEGYFILWDDDNQVLFSAKNSTSMEKVKEIVEYAIKKKVFNDKLFVKYSILTSHGIQSRYRQVIKDLNRVNGNISTVYDLININSEETQEISKETDINSEETPNIPEVSTQSKVKERKEKEIKEVAPQAATPKEPKKTYGEFENVTLTDKEYNDKLIAVFGEKQTKAIIEKLSQTKATNAKLKYASDMAAIRKWVIEAVGAKPLPPVTPYVPFLYKIGKPAEAKP